MAADLPAAAPTAEGPRAEPEWTEVERLRAALDDIERRGYEWASEDFDSPASSRFAALATIATEALYPKTEADEMDCRSYCK